jgi:hypothetical protein
VTRSTYSHLREDFTRETVAEGVKVWGRPTADAWRDVRPGRFAVVGEFIQLPDADSDQPPDDRPEMPPPTG